METFSELETPLDWTKLENKEVILIDAVILKNWAGAEYRAETDKGLSSYITIIDFPYGYCMCKDFLINKKRKIPCKHLSDLYRRMKK